MKKYLLILIGLAGVLSITSCTKKSTKLDFFEVACRNMKIKHPSALFLGDGTWESDATCGTTPYMGSVNISFDFNGDQKCLHKIKLGKVGFWAGSQKLHSEWHTAEMLKADPVVTIHGNRVTYTFCFQMKSQQDWDDLTHFNVRWHVENEIEDKSNTLLVRVNIPGKGPDPSTYDVKNTVTVNSPYIDLRLWDHASEDGDIVSVSLNGVWVINHHTLTKAGDHFALLVSPGDNHLVVYAENEGSSGPNTCSISINGGKKITLNPDLLTGEAINIQF